jgi:phosphoenolpyruvate-protein kinase (PTS system EI component)
LLATSCEIAEFALHIISETFIPNGGDATSHTRILATAEKLGLVVTRDPTEEEAKQFPEGQTPKVMIAFSDEFRGAYDYLNELAQASDQTEAAA